MNRPLVQPKTGSGDHINSLDYVRGFAILFVVAYHALFAAYGHPQLKWDGWFRSFDEPRSFLTLLPLTFGWGGVAIFFVVSGFCIHLSHERSSRKDFKVYFARRFFRIYPPYLVALCFFALLFPWTRLSFGSTQGLVQAGSHALLVHNLGESTYYGINGSFWSIAVEVQLYLLYPLLLSGVKRFGWTRALWVTGLIEVGLRTFRCLEFFDPKLHLPLILSGGPFIYWFSWTIGAKLADDWLNRRSLFVSHRLFWLWTVLAVTTWFIQPFSVFTFLLIALSASQAMAWLLSHPDAKTPLPRFLVGHLRWAGVVSYSMYLFHQPLLNLYQWVLKHLFSNHDVHPLLRFVCCLGTYPLIFAVSWLSYRFVEVPSIEVGKWLVRTKLTPTSPLPIPPGQNPPEKQKNPVLGK